MCLQNAVQMEVVNKEGEVNPVENNKNDSEIAGLEQLLKNKTLSRSAIIFFTWRLFKLVLF